MRVSLEICLLNSLGRWHTDSGRITFTDIVMAHANIDERRAFVQHLLSAGVQLDHRRMMEVAQRFHCTSSAVRADIYSLTRQSGLDTAHTSQALRRAVRTRDADVCQYCGWEVEEKSCVVEHVVPASVGGVARPYNLVVACQSCNSRKRSRVWIPRNLDAITAADPAWKEKIVDMADPDQPAFLDFR